MTLYRWLQASGSNANADSTVNWAEGQAPSTVNDSGRAMMAATAKYRDDIAGAIVTAGTPTAYTVSSYEVFDTLAHLNGQVIAFTPHITNGATVTLNVDSLGAKPLRTSPNVELQSGVLIQGTPYVAVYNNADGAFYLRGFFGNPYNIPLGAGLDYWGPTTPNSCFAFPAGQAISRTTYAAFFTLIGITYGAGDGSSTFNLPDKTGRISAMKEASATRLTSSYFGGNSTNLGATGGVEDQTVGLGHLPTSITSATSGAVTSSFSGGRSAPTTMGGISGVQTAGGVQAASPSTTAGGTGDYAGQSSVSTSGAVGVTSNNTGSNAAGGAKNLTTVQPTIICNYIIRVL